MYFTATKMDSNELLCIVVKTDRDDVTEHLLNTGSDTNYVDENGKCVLFHAFESCESVKQVIILLAHGVKLDATYNGDTILELECGRLEPNLKLVKLLMDNGVNPNTVKEKMTPLAALVVRNNIDGVKLMLSYPNVNVNQTCNNGITAIRFACSMGYLTVVTLLLDAGADVNLQGIWGLTALMRAIERGHPELVPIILQHNVAVNLQDTIGFTALHHACSKDQTSSIYHLLRAGADPTIKDNSDKTAVEYCTLPETKWIINNSQSSTQPVVRKKLVTNYFVLPGNKATLTGHTGPKYQTWDNTSRRWSEFKTFAWISKATCEYTEEKMLYHIIENIRIRFNYILRADGTKIEDPYVGYAN